MFDFIFGKTHTYRFTHPKGPTADIKARSEEKAWSLLKSRMISQAFGHFALWYDESAIKSVMKEITVEKIS